MGKKTDHTGVKYGRLTGIREVGKKNRSIVWEFLCDCGALVETVGSSVKFGHTLSCGCLKLDKIKESSTKHGKYNTQEYKAWKLINTRCYNKNRKDWHRYGGSGLTSDFRYDFPAFLAEIGNIPNEEEDWSVDRIDTTKGYVRGNIRWATTEQQSKNKRMQSNNKSGKTGVSIKETESDILVTAKWNEGGKSRTKTFSANKYGYDKAFKLACDYRDAMIQKLIASGESYTEFHGN